MYVCAYVCVPTECQTGINCQIKRFEWKEKSDYIVAEWESIFNSFICDSASLFLSKIIKELLQIKNIITFGATGLRIKPI